MKATDAAIIVLLLLIIVQDLKFRAIHLFVFVILYAVVIMNIYIEIDLFEWMNVILNLSYLLILIAILFIYIRVKSGNWLLIDKGLGLGDLVFWFIVCFYMEFTWFLIWFNVSLIFALITHLFLKNYKFYSHQGKIPLAGLQAIILIIFICIL